MTDITGGLFELVALAILGAAAAWLIMSWRGQRQAEDRYRTSAENTKAAVDKLKRQKLQDGGERGKRIINAARHQEQPRDDKRAANTPPPASDSGSSDFLLGLATGIPMPSPMGIMGAAMHSSPSSDHSPSSSDHSSSSPSSSSDSGSSSSSSSSDGGGGGGGGGGGD